MHLCKIRNVELLLVGITSATATGGTLRNVGVSRFRRADGSIVSRMYPGDVMPISQYDVRGDALLFRFNPNELRAFELNGIDALWQLDLPQSANGFELSRPARRPARHLLRRLLRSRAGGRRARGTCRPPAARRGRSRWRWSCPTSCSS